MFEHETTANYRWRPDGDGGNKLEHPYVSVDVGRKQKNPQNKHKKTQINLDTLN